MTDRRRHFDSYVKAREHLAELESLFDLRWAADMRAIKRWQEGHPERKRIWPDHADLVVWLLERVERLESARSFLVPRHYVDDDRPDAVPALERFVRVRLVEEDPA